MARWTNGWTEGYGRNVTRSFPLSKERPRSSVPRQTQLAHRESQAFRSFRLAYSVTSRDIYVSSCSDVFTHEKEHGIPQQKVHILTQRACKSHLNQFTTWRRISVTLLLISNSQLRPGLSSGISIQILQIKICMPTYFGDDD
jgi:hypothetical protein